MDTKEIVEKVLKGEDYSTLVKELTPEKQTEALIAVRDALDSQVKNKQGDLKKATDDLISVRKGIKDIEDKGKPPIPDVLETFKKEQLEKAKRKFFSDPRYPVTAEQRQKIETQIEGRGITSTDSDFVFDEIKQIYGAITVDTLIDEREKAVKGQQGAARFVQSQAGAPQGSGGTPDPDKYSTQVQELWSAVVKSGHKNFTLDDAKKQFEKGRNFAKNLL